MTTKNRPTPASAPRKPYLAPAIVYQARLEAQAGSPLGADPLQGLFHDSLTAPGK